MKVALLIPDNRDEFRQYSDPSPHFGPAPTALLRGFEQLAHCEIHVVSCLHKPLPSPERIGPNIYYHSLPVRKVGWRPTAYAGCILAIRRKLRELNPDIVHGQGTERYCALAAVKSGWPNVITIHGNMRGMARVRNASVGTFFWFAALFESFALKRTQGVFCNSVYTKQMVKPLAAKTWRVANALRPEFFAPTPAREQKARPILLNVGTIAPHKRQIELLEIARRLFRVGYRFELRFVGDATPHDSYGRAFTDRIRAAECEEFARHIAIDSTSALVKCFDQAHALVHFPTEEAFGLVVAEALARNLKFFGCRTGGIPEVAANIELAELYGAEDWEALERGLARWIDNGSPTPHSAASEMEKRYRPLIIAQRHVEIYHTLLDAAPGSQE